MASSVETNESKNKLNHIQHVLIIIYQQVISGHLGWVRSIGVDPSNEWFATGSGDRTIKVCISVLLKYCTAYIVMGVIKW